MDKLYITVGDKKYDVEIASTEEEKTKGLQKVKRLPENQGMLFVNEEPEDVKFWMKDTLIPLDLIFINDDYKVIKVVEGKPEDETMIDCNDVLYTLEVNKDSGIKAGDDFDFNDNLRVLDKKGNTQYEMEQGARIFSRKNTLTLIRMAKRARAAKTDTAYKKLGLKIFEYIDIVDSTKPQYVESPNK